MTTTTTTSSPQKTAELFPAAVYGGRVARALDALAALDARVRADLLLRGAVAPETVPFVCPHAGSLYGVSAVTVP
jgi:hypothetical protein